METPIEFYRSIIVQIATPYSRGTGFYFPYGQVIVTNEHIVRDNSSVVIEGASFERQMAEVVYLDPKYDLAFVKTPESIAWNDPLYRVHPTPVQGETVLALGNPFGLKFNTTQGIISNADHTIGEVNYLLHDAALNPGNSGGPLLDEVGKIIGVNTFIVKDGVNIGFALPIKYLLESVDVFLDTGGGISTRCDSCRIVVTTDTIQQNYCPNCGAEVLLPNMSEPYEPLGIAKTIEEIIQLANHKVELSRRGPNNWEIKEGTAKVNISYYEKTGLITGDAYLCSLPKENIKPLYEYLLRLNYKVEGLTFSIKGQDIVLSLLIYDRYLNPETGLELFKHLFSKADYYDNILVEEFGAHWKNEEYTVN